jgi:cobalt-zinc-cadmium efflux system outer membrane protein
VDLGRSEIDALVKQRGQSVDESISSETSAKLLSDLKATPLTPDSVTRIVLMNSPRLKATYAELGFAAADIYEASRIRNPAFGGSRLDSNVVGDRDQLTLGLVTSFTDLITLPARKRLSASAFTALKESIGAEVLSAAAEAQMAYYRHVSTRQIAALRAQVANAAALSAALAERYHDAGNMNARELALERAAESQARVEALEAQAQTYAARTELATVLGLTVGDHWDVPTRLHAPLDNEDDLPTLITLARESRLDLAAAHSRADMLAYRLGVVNWTRWLGDLEVGVERERETDGADLTGPTVGWSVPIFNQHKDAILRTNANLQIAIAEVQRITTDVENSVRLAHAASQNAKARAEEYRDVLIPQRIEAVARAQEEVNFMLIGIFELINIKREEYSAYQAYLEAIRDYWLARVELHLAVGNSLPGSAAIGDHWIDVEDFVRPQPGTKDHDQHSGMKKKDEEHTDHEVPDKANKVEEDSHEPRHEHDGGSQ